MSMNRYWRRVKQYIRTKFFRKTFDPFEAVDIQMAKFMYDIDEAALNIRDAIDKEILGNLYKQAAHDLELEVIRRLLLGEDPKIFVRPPVLSRSEIIELEGGRMAIQINWGGGVWGYGSNES